MYRLDSILAVGLILPMQQSFGQRSKAFQVLPVSQMKQMNLPLHILAGKQSLQE
ncbi:hypothetical protein P353_08000 [Comamonas testosteroni]|uniref:Uncharacterized protein n=1 Tax=Comamonas testosteroni TaxID=285 RepID=A0A096HPA2_COMTE|nr:hypothetical protein P353_08000 [Comamonas testosteroni]